MDEEVVASEEFVIEEVVVRNAAKIPYKHETSDYVSFALTRHENPSSHEKMKKIYY